MADGSRSVVLEADTAAKAAREAKTEAPEVQSAAAPAPAHKVRRLGRKAGWAEFIVDVWITNFHSVKFGFCKHLRNQAKTIPFTPAMNSVADVIDPGPSTRHHRSPH